MSEEEIKLLDHFSGLAMQSLYKGYYESDVAEKSYRMACAMLEKRLELLKIGYKNDN